MQARMIDNEIRMMKQEKLRLDHERSEMVEVSSVMLLDSLEGAD